jgi:S1-C subfamily serine protease
MVARSSFWFASAAWLGLTPLDRAQDTAPREKVPAASVVEIIQQNATKRTSSLGVHLEGDDDLVTVLSSAEQASTYQCKLGDVVQPAQLLLFDEKSHLALLRCDKASAAGLAPAASRTLTADSRLLAAADGKSVPVRLAGRVKLLEGRPLLLTLLRLHAGTAKLRPGTPIIDADGRMVALTLSALDDEDGAWLAVPVEATVKVARDYKRFGAVETGQLEVGVAIGTTTPRLEFVKAGSRAEQAGLHSGDVILQIGDQPVGEALDILDANFYLTTHEPVSIRALRGLNEVTVTAPAAAAK